MGAEPVQTDRRNKGFSQDAMEEPEDQSLCSDQRSAGPAWAFLHKPIISMVMGSLMSAAGALLLLLRSAGVSGASRSVASACLSVGLTFVAVGLVWIPVLKEKRRRRRLSQGLEDEC
ncbi:phosphoinositide-interacting protein-like [Poecilia reticulata]|uniref:phosphoinositide-interacting protein-like n=1 Tax=Poecilia reticulata TaxID=8081 RepID=UPI0004A3C067|nr:PREDICTED: phosphoinositide-interacting protein-like [Poecilia reticulata]